MKGMNAEQPKLKHQYPPKRNPPERASEVAGMGVEPMSAAGGYESIANEPNFG